MNNRLRILKITQTAVLAGIILLMAFTPLGYVHAGPVSIALVTIPVVIGAMVVGPVCGLVLGLVFGLSSFAQCFGMDFFGTTLFGIHPFLTFVMCVPTRILMGWLAGVLFRLFRKADRTRTVCYFAGGLLGALLNTVFFMAVFISGFFHTEYVQNLAEGRGILAFIAFLVGINGLVEMAACCIIGGGISKILSRLLKSTSDGVYL
ncbi:MAG: ECF transporter S component [Lachnospiraceae bacterium]|nr:ECF transporter S component [Lachnospiraceae bacterium]